MRLTPARQRPAIDNRRKPRELLGGQGRDRPDDLPLLIRHFSIRLDSKLMEAVSRRLLRWSFLAVLAACAKALES
jgi:hypothetical protein